MPAELAAVAQGPRVFSSVAQDLGSLPSTVHTRANTHTQQQQKFKNLSIV